MEELKYVVQIEETERDIGLRFVQSSSDESYQVGAEGGCIWISDEERGGW